MTAKAKPRYCIDTSSLLQLWVRAYPPDNFGGVWEKIDALIAEKRLVAPVDVRLELAAREDPLHDWAKAKDDVFVEIEPNVQEKLKEVLRVSPGIISEHSLKSNADPVVVAFAAAENCVVVTEETLSRSPKETKIPNACLAMKVEYINVLQMIRAEGWRFRATE